MNKKIYLIFNKKDAAVKDLKYRCMQDKAEYDKEIARLMVILNDLQRKLQEKDEELNSLKKQEENLKKSPNKPNNQFYEDENKFLQQEKRNLEGKIMQLLSENDKIKRKFDDVLQDNSANKIGHKDLLSTSPIKQKPDLDVTIKIYSAKLKKK